MIDFDVAPDGRAVVEGQDFSDLYAPVGVRFSSSIDDAVISATKYRVRPRKGFSAGNSEPLYRGSMTVHFYVPGMKKVPGAVHFVAFYAAYVTPNSLSLTAYGLDGKLLGEVRSEGRGSDFLGLHSKAPISRIEIENDETLHKGYVIDDLRFDSPKRLPSTPIP